MADLPTHPYSEATEATPNIPVEARAVMARLDLASRALPRDIQARVFVLAGELYERGVAAGRAQAAADIRAKLLRAAEAEDEMEASPRLNEDAQAVARWSAVSYRAAARVAERVAEGGGEADPSKGLKDRVWWLHRCDQNDPKRSWLSETPGELRPDQCPRCGGGSGWGWFEARPVGAA